MIIAATEAQIYRALEEVNSLYENNIKIKNMSRLSKNRLSVSLTVKSSRAPGARTGRGGRRIAACCWFVFGHFQESLFRQGVKYIKTAFCTMRSNADNWQGEYRNIGSMFEPLYMGHACGCEDHPRKGALYNLEKAQELAA